MNIKMHITEIIIVELMVIVTVMPILQPEFLQISWINLREELQKSEILLMKVSPWKMLPYSMWIYPVIRKCFRQSRNV